MSERVTKLGNCHQCLRSEVKVSWHPASKTFYCEDCWPAIHESRQQERRESRMPSAAELARMRDHMYGYRIEDDPRHPAAFVALCPEHGVIGDDLNVAAARRLRDNHGLSHPASNAARS